MPAIVPKSISHFCTDHVAAAYAHAELYKQYTRKVAKCKKYRVKKNFGKPGYTWFVKGDIVLAYEYPEDYAYPGYSLSAYSGHKNYGYEVHWCLCKKSHFELVGEQ